MITDTSGKGFPMSVTERIIDEAFDLYMPQVRSEITQLTNFIKWEHSLNKENYTILEIGTKFGGTFYIWNSINPNGKNISIDMADGLHGGISEEEMDKRDLWFKERFDNCHFIRGNSHDFSTTMQLTSILGETNGFGRKINEIDFLFIDGDHTYKGVEQDFENFSRLVKKGGCIAFHDIIISDHHHSRDVYVGEFWNEIKNDDRFDSFEFVEPGNNWGGIGVLIKK